MFTASAGSAFSAVTTERRTRNISGTVFADARPRIVNVKGEGYECARRYMTRLEPSDFTNPDRLARMARIVKMEPEQFTQRFGHVVGR